MLTRTLTAVVGVPLLVGVVWVGGYAFAALATATAGVGAWELCRMARGWGQPPYAVVAIALAAVVAASGHLIPAPEAGLFMPLAILLGGIGALILLNGYRARGRFGSILSTVAIALFIGGALFMATSIRNVPEDGRAMILFLITITFVTDTGAYLVGKAIGRRKMTPRVSPNKTWEGATGGLLAAGATGAILVWVMSEFQPVSSDLIAMFAVGATLGVTGQFGDLFISRLKRRAGFDDSGFIVPGHGGLLDRLDSLTFNLLAFTPATAVAIPVSNGVDGVGDILLASALEASGLLMGLA